MKAYAYSYCELQGKYRFTVMPLVAPVNNMENLKTDQIINGELFPYVWKDAWKTNA